MDAAIWFIDRTASGNLSDNDGSSIGAQADQYVYPKPGMEANMVLIEAIKDGKPKGTRIMPPLIVAGEDGEYGPGSAGDA